MRLPVLYERGPTSWGAYAPDLPGCIAVGDTLEEVKALFAEAVIMHLEGVAEDGESPLEPRHEVGYVDVPAE